MNLASAFALSAEKHGPKAGLFWGETGVSYRAILDQSLRLGCFLRDECHLQRGARVGLWLKNCPEFIPSLFGILQAGAVAVPINNFLKTDEVNYILGDAGIDVLITDAELGPHHRALEASRPH